MIFLRIYLLSHRLEVAVLSLEIELSSVLSLQCLCALLSFVSIDFFIYLYYFSSLMFSMPFNTSLCTGLYPMLLLELLSPSFFPFSFDFDFYLDTCKLYLIKSLILLFWFFTLFNDLLLLLPCLDSFFSSKAETSIFLAVILLLEFKVCLLLGWLELVLSLSGCVSG